MPDHRSPSDVFLELWRARGLQTSEAFRECAESWLQIRELEMMARCADGGSLLKQGTMTVLTPYPVDRAAVEKAIREAAGLPSPSPASPPKSTPKSTPESTPESTPDEGEKVHHERVESTPPEGVQNGPPARDNPEIGRKAYAARKANMREALDRVRASGVSMQSIADASGLSLNDVLDFLAAKPLPLPKIAKLGKGLGKLEEAEA